MKYADHCCFHHNKRRDNEEKQKKLHRSYLKVGSSFPHKINVHLKSEKYKIIYFCDTLGNNEFFVVSKISNTKRYRCHFLN